VFFSSLPADTLRRFEDIDDIETDIVVPMEDERQHFSLSISPIQTTEQPKGRVIVLRDITPIKRREEDLKAREEELDLLRQLFSRVLRHNIRNELTVIKGTGEQIAREAGDPHEALAELIVDSSEDLLAMSHKARHIERIVDEDEDTVEYDLRELAERTIKDVYGEYPEATFELTGETNCRVECNPGLDTALWNLVENAVEHGSSAQESRTPTEATPAAAGKPTGHGFEEPPKRTDGTGPDVRVEIGLNDGCPLLTVSDDGPGIESEELTVLDEAAETQLLHGSGIGLWLVKWVVDRSDATLCFDTGPDGTDVTIRFAEAAVV
jgi:signal transduction histidine kinase